MNGNNLRLIGLLEIVFGGLFLLLAGIAYIYQFTMVDIVDGSRIDTPLRQYFDGLLIVGILLLVAGLGFYWKANQEQPQMRARSLAILALGVAVYSTGAVLMKSGKELLGENYTPIVVLTLLTGIVLVVRAFVGWSKEVPDSWELS